MRLSLICSRTWWREVGVNGYIWAVSTPSIRYYEYHQSRAGDVVKELIGEHYTGVLGSDFYAAYNIHQGLHQRCWVHFLRDVHDLKESHPQDEALLTWAKDVKALYEQAVAWVGHDLDPTLSPRQQNVARVKQQHLFEQHLWHLCQPFVRTAAPHHTLCERVERFLPELFVFVAIPGFPSHNSLAERDIRMVKVQKKSPAVSSRSLALRPLLAFVAICSRYASRGCLCSRLWNRPWPVILFPLLSRPPSQLPTILEKA